MHCGPERPRVLTTAAGSDLKCLSHELRPCIEVPSRYILLVHWRRLEDHTIGFRQSAKYQQWRALLHHFYDPFPTVEHYGESLVANPPATLLAPGFEPERIPNR